MAKAQELMEQNPELSKAVTELEEQTLEEQVLAKLKEIESILTKLDGESINLSVFLDQIQSFSDEKKAELQALVDKLDNPLGEKTITIETCRECCMINGAIVWQEVYKKDGAITKYGDFFMQGARISGTQIAGGSVASPTKLPLPQDVEFDYLNGSYGTFYARPKAGQSNKDGIVGSLDSYLYIMGASSKGESGMGTSAIQTYTKYKFEHRVKKVSLGTRADGSNYSATCFALLDNGDLYYAGNNAYGQAGVGNKTQANSWAKSNSNVINIFSSPFCAYAVKDGALFCSGVNAGKQMPITDTDSWTQVKTLEDASSVNMWFAYRYIGGSVDASHTFLLDNGKLYGVGFNSYNQIVSTSTSVQSTFQRVTNGSGDPFPADTDMQLFSSLDDVYILTKNSSGNKELYSSGYGRFGRGKGETADTNEPMHLIKTFDGEDWELQSSIMPNRIADNDYDKYTYALFISNAKLGKLEGFGSIAFGIGIGGTSDVNTLTSIPLPKGEVYEFWNNAIREDGSIVVVCDGVIYSCGKNTSGRIPYQSNILIPIN